ncbi:MAG: phosphatase PAP2 family protein, partial [Candidatus Uhrbacteria bacterium]|nr:phosphatase PAP2 family protein [Candidatus Uhrbacteria bacterium]
MKGEIEIIHGLQTLFQSPAGQGFVVFCARWLIFVFVVLVAATGIPKQNKVLRYAAYEAACAAILALFIAKILSHGIGRLRPFLVGESVLFIPPPLSVFAFPSSHASVAFAIAGALAYGNPTLGIIGFIMAFFIAFGRVASGVHYPSDVFGGLIVGLISFGIVRLIHRAIRAKYRS